MIIMIIIMMITITITIMINTHTHDVNNTYNNNTVSFQNLMFVFAA